MCLQNLIFYISMWFICYATYNIYIVFFILGHERTINIRLINGRVTWVIPVYKHRELEQSTIIIIFNLLIGTQSLAGREATTPNITLEKSFAYSYFMHRRDEEWGIRRHRNFCPTQSSVRKTFLGFDSANSVQSKSRHKSGISGSGSPICISCCIVELLFGDFAGDGLRPNLKWSHPNSDGECARLENFLSVREV